MMDVLLVLLILTNLFLLGVSRIGTCIRTVAFQGVILGVLIFVSHWPHPTIHTGILSLGSLALKGAVFPWLLFRALREAQIRREVEPLVGYNASLLIGILALILSFFLAARLPLPIPKLSPLLMPVALFSIQAGLFLIVSRRRAIHHVLGYLVFENGIYGLGISLSQREPLLVELGVLLDVFVAVFVMGITIFHIHREFDHIDTLELSALKDYL